MNIFNLKKVHEVTDREIEEKLPEEEDKQMDYSEESIDDLLGTNTSVTEARNDKFK